VIQWRDLSLGEQCVMVAAFEQADVSSALSDWDPHWRDGDAPAEVRFLADCVISLAERSLIEVSLSPDGAALQGRELREVAHDQRAWILNQDEELEIVAWLLTTDTGDEVVRTATSDDFYAYQKRPGRVPAS
jgi:hypothetical protein